MLRPVLNNFRSLYDLSGLWQFKIDKNEIGIEENWFRNFLPDSNIAVPGSWHEQLDDLDLQHYIGTAWYSKEFFVPSGEAGKRLFLRFNSVDYICTVWLNGEKLGENNIGYLPFEFEITDQVRIGEENKLILSVNNKLTDDTIPQGIYSSYYTEENRLRDETYPAARFDFLPSGGIHRQVLVYSLPQNFIENVRVNTKILDESNGSADILIEMHSEMDVSLQIEVEGFGTAYISTVEGVQKIYTETVKIENCKFWNVGDPNLYKLKIIAKKDGKIFDEYELIFGVREIKVEAKRFLINGKPVYFKGFGKHEDYPVFGKGFNFQYLVKDFGLMKWINANSFRTSHYPYAEEFLDMADSEGFLVIDEVPAVSIDTRRTNEKTIANHKRFIERLIKRDYNHPSVVAWAVGNEPNLVGADSYSAGSGYNYWKEIFDFARTQDATRPFTVPNCQRAGTNDPVLGLSDFITINRYYGWYEIPGRIDEGIERLSAEIDELFEKYQRPVMMTEFGADTMSGFHSIGDQMFTEEYQARLIEAYIKCLRSKDCVVGEHIWNFADFRTPQHFRRVVNNLKGIFTRDRSPKLAAFRVKELWND